MTSISPARVAVSETSRSGEPRSEYHIPYVLGRPAREKTQRFFERALEAVTDECIVWPYARDLDGYAKMRYGGRSRVVSKIVCRIVNGPAPTGTHQAAHSCNNPPCINGRHLTWKTPRENSADKIDGNTVCLGEKNGSAKLTAEDVRQIRHLAGSGSSSRKIATAFRINKDTAWKIITRKKWRHVA